MSQDFGDTDGAFQRYKEFYEMNQNSAEMWSNLGNGYLEREIYVSVGSRSSQGAVLLQKSALSESTRLGVIL